MADQKVDLNKLGEDCKWTDLTCGLQMYKPATSKEFKTGEWTAIKPEFFEDRCKQCLLCVPCCPDSAIPVKDYKRQNFDYDHCKGCGICVKVCPFKAIEMKGVNK